MTELRSQINKDIQEFSLGIFPQDGDLVMPFYEGLSLVNIPSTICRFLSVPEFGQQPLDARVTGAIGESYEKVIVLLIDAMGYRLFNRMIDPARELFWGRYADRAVYFPLASVCPSTTASALTTLWTGQGPAAHGIIGYEMWAKEFGMVINNIIHSAASARGDMGGLARSGFDPHAFLSMPVLGTHLQNHGVSSTAFIHASIAYSGLSTMQMTDVHVKGFVDEADLCVSLADYLNKRAGTREFIYIYYSDVDTLMHRFTADDARVDLQFGAFSSLFTKGFINNLTRQVAQEMLLILTADHGAKNTPKRKQYDLAYHPKLRDYLVMQPTCENRLAFLYIKPGRIGDVQDYFRNAWPGQFVLLDPDQALEKGLFGREPFKPETRERLGDMIAVAIGDAYLWWANKANLMVGRHGGLSSDEMLVPFYALPLGDLVS